MMLPRLVASTASGSFQCGGCGWYCTVHVCGQHHTHRSAGNSPITWPNQYQRGHTLTPMCMTRGVKVREKPPPQSRCPSYLVAAVPPVLPSHVPQRSRRSQPAGPSAWLHAPRQQSGDDTPHPHSHASPPLQHKHGTGVCHRRVAAHTPSGHD